MTYCCYTDAASRNGDHSYISWVIVTKNEFIASGYEEVTYDKPHQAELCAISRVLTELMSKMKFAKDDKIIIFSDNIFSVKAVKSIIGKTPMQGFDMDKVAKYKFIKNISECVKKINCDVFIYKIIAHTGPNSPHFYADKLANTRLRLGCG